MKHSFVAVAFAMIIAMTYTSCSKQESKPIAPANEAIDPATDMVACTDPVSHILYVLPNMKDSVLHQLNARSTDGEHYTMSAMAVSRHTVPFTFRVQTVLMNEILFQAGQQLRFFAIRDVYDRQAVSDTARGTFIGKLDSLGVCYRVYINAECKEVARAFESGCTKEIRMIIRPDSIIDYVETGKYVQYKTYAQSHCLKGKGSCIEALTVLTEMRLYNAAGCAGAPLETIVVNRDFTCVN